MMFAVDAAQDLRENGETTEVCLMDENGQFRPEWSLGQDTYPPKL